jgi:hypothetical protein
LRKGCLDFLHRNLLKRNKKTARSRRLYSLLRWVGNSVGKGGMGSVLEERVVERFLSKDERRSGLKEVWEKVDLLFELLTKDGFEEERIKLIFEEAVLVRFVDKSERRSRLKAS